MKSDWIVLKTDNSEIIYSESILGVVYKFGDKFFCYVHDNNVNENLERIDPELMVGFDSSEIAKDILVKFNETLKFEKHEDKYLSKNLIGFISKVDDKWQSNFRIFSKSFNTLEEAKRNLLDVNIKTTHNNFAEII